MTREYVIEGLVYYTFDEVVAFIKFVRSKFINEIDIYYSGDDNEILTNNLWVAEFFELICFEFREIKPLWFKTIFIAGVYLLLFFIFQTTISFLLILPEVISKFSFVASI